MKTHKIKTIQDVVNAVDEKNIDAFLVDFKSFLTTITILKVNGSIPKIETMTWVDDGKNDVTIDLKDDEIGNNLGSFKFRKN
jgi:hypothetical protein